MDHKIQTIIFPQDERHLICKELFYRGESGYYDKENKIFSMGYGQVCNLMTYINACSWRKWKKYTVAKSLSFHVVVEGPCAITYLGESLELFQEMRTDFKQIKDERSEKREIVFEYPENNEAMLGAEITALGICRIYDAFYTVSCDEKDMNYVRISLATTTCRKENFIKKTVALLKSDILGSDDEIKDNFEVHVVDNGNTLSKEEIEGKNVFLHPNPNTGGSGGFARGMYETRHLENPATHILLMDDDVLILPESIKRTYNILRLVKPEYKNHFINGAMLRYEQPYCQYEDLGTLSGTELFKPLKPKYDHRRFLDNLRCDSAYFNNPNTYGAWWYSCIPMEAVKENGYPMPFFVRGDDSEYALRYKAKYITMNGICLWHMGFSAKFNGAMDIYQQFRNLLILQASTEGIVVGIDLHDIFRRYFKNDIRKFNYCACDQYLRAFEDFLKGPSFIETCNGEQIVKDNVALNEKFVPLSEHPEISIYDARECFKEGARPAVSRFMGMFHWWFTDNGHKALKKPKDIGLPIGGFNFTVQLTKMAGVRKYASVNPYAETVSIRQMDVPRYKALMKKFKALEKDYKKRRPEIERQYREAHPYLTSEEFWVKYLGLDK